MSGKRLLSRERMRKEKSCLGNRKRIKFARQRGPSKVLIQLIFQTMDALLQQPFLLRANSLVFSSFFQLYHHMRLQERGGEERKCLIFLLVNMKYESHFTLLSQQNISHKSTTIQTIPVWQIQKPPSPQQRKGTGRETGK